MPEVLASKQDKKDVLDAVVLDMLADELPVTVQEKLPDGGNTIVQAPGDNLTVKTGIVDELPKKRHLSVPEGSTKGFAGTMGTISIAATVLGHMDKNKAENASDVLKFIGDELIREGELITEGKIPTAATVDVERLKKGMNVAGKAIMIAGRVCIVASKSVKFFLKFAPKK